MNRSTGRRGLITVPLLVTLVLLLSTSGFARHQVTIPEGTVVELRMESGLSSASAQVGDTFQSTITRDVFMDNLPAIPEGSRVDGRVTLVREAERGQSGVIGVEFYRVTFPNGESYPVTGTLTSLDPEVRREILEEEGRIRGEGTRERTMVFVGGGAGLGAVVGAIAGGKSGAIIGAIAGGILGGLLSEGKEAEVSAGTQIAMQFDAPLTIETESAQKASSDDRMIHTSREEIRAAQRELQRLGYYRGAIDGTLGPGTRRALTRFQLDRNQSPTGNLDHQTAVALGITSATTPRQARFNQFEQAGEMVRSARQLLEDYERTLGVNVVDITPGLRRGRTPTEAQLDLLLQLDSFVTAASWLEQASRTTAGGADMANLEEVVERTATRVDQSMGATTVPARIQSQWTSIRTDLREMGMASTDTEFRTNGQYTGQLRWSGLVDGTDNIHVQGSSVRINHLSGRQISNQNFDLDGTLPRTNVRLVLQKVQGRGELRILEQPNRFNNYTAVVQITDRATGAGWYEFVLSW